MKNRGMNPSRCAVVATLLVSLAVSGCDPSNQSQPNTPASASTVASPQPSTSPTMTTTPSAAPSTVPAAVTATPGDVVSANNAFALKLFDKVRTTPGNMAFSPASISVALSMTYAGANGATAEQMASTLSLPQDAAGVHEGWKTQLATWQARLQKSEAGASERYPAFQLAVANRLFGQKGFAFEKPFLAQAQDSYAAPLEQLDFATNAEAQRKHINGWVSKRTKQRIEDLIPSGALDSDTRMVLTNAIYFKDTWSTPFVKTATKDADFYVSGKKAAAVPMMRRAGSMAYGETADAQLIEMRYRGSNFGFVALLPRKRDGLAAMEASLDNAALAAALKGMTPQRVDVQLPRFKVEPSKSLALSELLKEMGMTLPFVRGKADFSKMANPVNPDDRLHISEVFHKAFVAVDEAGTEAAAATAVVMARAGSARPPGPPKAFLADHPFLFLIRDSKSGMILFVGRVDDPRSKG